MTAILHPPAGSGSTGTEAPKTLGVLVANVGVGALGFTETLPMPVVRQMFEVNVYVAGPGGPGRVHAPRNLLMCRVLCCPRTHRCRDAYYSG